MSPASASRSRGDQQGWGEGYVYAVDGQGYFYRPGPRIVDSLETLAGLLHPDLFGEFLPPEGELYCRVTT
jgi:hypothetical protein